MPRFVSRSRLRSTAALLATLALPTPARASAPARGLVDGVPRRPAAAAPLGLLVVAMGDTALTLDSNKPAISGPNTMYVHYRVTNSSAATYQGLLATLGGFTADVALGGSQRASQYLPTLAPGASADVYWFLTYSRVIGRRAVLTVTVSDGAGNSSSGSGVVATTAMMSTGTGGALSSQQLTATNLGMITYIDVSYVFAGNDVGGTFNLQPSGNADLRADCFQLVGSQVLSSDLPADIPVGTTNRMFFTATTKTVGSGKNVSMRYFFRVQCLGVASDVKPYANETSGNSLKYSSNYDTWVGSGGGIAFPAVGNPITVTKSSTPDSLADGGTATYTVTLANTVSTGAATVDSIVDVLPAGARFDSLAATSQITAANSAAVPAAGATGRIVFRSVPGTYYTVPAAGTLQLVYKATIPAPEGTYTNTATGFVALTNAGSAGSAVVVRRKSDLVVAKTGSDSARMRDTVTYVIATTNLGPSAADTVVVRDTLPAQLTFVRGTRGATAAGGAVTFPFFLRLPKDSTLRDTVVAVVADTGAVVNRAAASSHALDPQPANSDGSAAASRKATTLRKELITVAVAPDGLAAPSKRLPGTAYAESFTITNTGKYANDFDLLLRAQGAPPFLVRDSLQLPSGARVAADSVRLPLLPNLAQTVTVFYTVTMGDTAQSVFRLRARAARDTAAADTGWVPVRRVRPALTLAKSADASSVLPGADVLYTIQFANAGEHVADNAVVEDDVPPALQYKLGTLAVTLPAGVTGTLGFSSDGGLTWSYAPVSGACGAPAGYDGCVNRVRLAITTTLPAGAAGSTGTLRFAGRVR